MKYSQAVLLKLFTLLLFVIVGYDVQAQVGGSVQGIVLDEKGLPAANATIGVNTRDKFTMAGKDGRYQLQLNPGRYKISCSMIGYEQQEVEVTISATNVTVHNFRLKKAVNTQLDGVTVEGLSTKRQLETQGFAVSVIETKEAALRNLQTNELLDRTVGVRVRQNGGMGSNVEYNLNGMSGRAVGIFIDGIEISTYGSSFNLNNIPPAMIERIEVYKGVLPSHLSGDYMGGAINVVLKKDVSRNNLNASVSYGSFNTFQADASGMYRNRNNGFTVKGSGFYTYTDNSYEMWGKFSKFIGPDGRVTRNYKARRFNDAFKSLGARFEAGFTNVKWADQFLIGYNGSDTYKEIPHGQTMGRPYVGRFSEYQAHVFSLNYTKKDILFNGLHLNVNGLYSNRSTYLQDTVGYVYNWDGNVRHDLNGNPLYRQDEGQQGIKTMTDIDRKIKTLRSNLSYDVVSGHRVSINHVYYGVDRNDKDLLRPVLNTDLRTISDLSKHVTSFNYEAETFTRRLKTNLFAKYYQQNTAKSTPVVTNVNGHTVVQKVKESDHRAAWGYGVAASYAILSNVIAIGSAERAVRMPGESEIFGDPVDNVIANPGIRPEVSSNLNLGVRLGYFNFDRHRVSLSANGFVRNVKDRIMRRANVNLADNEVELTPFVNLGRAQSVGFEGELGYIYNNKLNFIFTFSKFNSLLKGTGSTADRLSGYYNKQIPNEPFFTMNGNVQYRLDSVLQKGSILNLFYNFGYVAPFRTIWPDSEWFTTPVQFSHDLGCSYRFPDKKMVVSFDAKNVFNAEIYDNFGVQKPGRAFYLKLNYTIQ
jgi:outer membrane cobalamin receptor